MGFNGVTFETNSKGKPWRDIAALKHTAGSGEARGTASGCHYLYSIKYSIYSIKY